MLNAIKNSQFIEYVESVNDRQSLIKEYEGEEMTSCKLTMSQNYDMKHIKTINDFMKKSSIMRLLNVPEIHTLSECDILLIRCQDIGDQMIKSGVSEGLRLFTGAKTLRECYNENHPVKIMDMIIYN